MEGDVVLGHADLLWNLCISKLVFVGARAFAYLHTNDLNLDIDLNETFTERVDLDETGVDSAIEATKLGDETDVTLRDRFVGVRTANAAGESSHGSNTLAQGVDCAKMSALCDL
jgi:hypothetical protein